MAGLAPMGAEGSGYAKGGVRGSGSVCQVGGSGRARAGVTIDPPYPIHDVDGRLRLSSDRDSLNAGSAPHGPDLWDRNGGDWAGEQDTEGGSHNRGAEGSKGQAAGERRRARDGVPYKDVPRIPMPDVAVPSVTVPDAAEDGGMVAMMVVWWW